MSEGEEIQRWVDPAMFESEPMGKTKQGNVFPRVTLLGATPDPLGNIAAACMMYEGKVIRDLAEVTDEQRRHYWDQVGATHLKAPLEFVNMHFLVEGVTRAFTHQHVRQRTAVYAQESLRFAVKENMAEEAAVPPSIASLEPDDPRREVWDQAMEMIGTSYNALVNSGIPAEDARGLLPHATTTRLHYGTNLRGLLDHAGNRLCTQAQFEWRMVFTSLVMEMRRFQNPLWTLGGGETTDRWQWEHIAGSGVFKPVCFQLGRCPFQAGFDRACTIRPRVQEGMFDQIRDEEWLLDPAAARRGIG